MDDFKTFKNPAFLVEMKTDEIGMKGYIVELSSYMATWISAFQVEGEILKYEGVAWLPCSLSSSSLLVWARPWCDKGQT